ncbi:hypothetical protein ACHAXT_010857 [Thalassiosira profunda]
MGGSTMHKPDGDRRRKRRRRSGLAFTAIASACVLHLAFSLLAAERGEIDYDHYVPGHRFLLQSDARLGANGANNNKGRRSLATAIIQSVTIRKRSKEDATALRKRSLRAAAARARKAEKGQSELAPDVEQAVLATANALDIPAERRPNVTEYDIDAALLAARAFHREVLFFVYDAATDDFVVVHNVPDCDWGCRRAYIVAPFLAAALRKNYPSRFQGAASGDWVVLLSVGDMPRIRRPCLFKESQYCKSDKWAPILQFGSVLADPIYMPSAMAMPQSPRPFVPCFDEFQRTGTVCQDLRPRTTFDEGGANAEELGGANGLKTGRHFQHGLVFGQEMGLLDGPDYWDELVPQVVWRGTDFMFLHTLFPDMRAPTYRDDIAPIEAQFGDDKTRSAIDALWALGDDVLTPRWRGVLLTSEAEQESQRAALEGEDLRPWVDIRFASCNVNGQKVPASQNEDFQLLQSKFGIQAVGNSMTMAEHARYRYHLDLGGGGGTTWTGTLEKLALPGVLFHHVTPTQDWYHVHLEPWVHFIPVQTDLSDLREKYEWAEAHPHEARRIAEAGTQFARDIGTVEGLAGMYHEHVVAPLGNAIAAYKNPRKKYQGKRALDILRESKGGEAFGVVAKCGGWPSEGTACRWTKRENDGKNGGGRGEVAATER